jgi:hypothetical protein
MLTVPTDLPGHELIIEGLDALAEGRESESGLLVAMAAPRLRALGFDVPDGVPRIASMSCSLGRARERTAVTTRWWPGS